MALDQRARLLLKTLVERHISEGQPIGSRTLAKWSGMDVSPATIRNVMSDLEDMGLVSSPHTSAGRVPTARGYRLFVDTILAVQPLAESVQQEMREHLLLDQPQRMKSAAADLLSDLSRFAGVVITPVAPACFKHIEFLSLSEKRILLILVTPEGDVQNRILFLEQTYTPSQLTEAANFINQHYAAVDLNTIRSDLHQQLKALRDDIVQLTEAAVALSAAALNERDAGYVVSGEKNLLGIAHLSTNTEQMRRLLDMFEQKTTLLDLLQASVYSHGVQIFIGDESDKMPIDQMAMVTAPYEVNGTVIGTLGVIGPTRMAYDRVIPIVDITAKLLSCSLTQGNA